MHSERIAVGKEHGVLIRVNEPGNLDSMYRYVTSRASEISSVMKGKLFALLTFDVANEEVSEACLKEEGWYPVHPRTTVQNASEWHSHYPVIIYCPTQKEIVIPTGITTQELLAQAEQETGIHSSTNLDRVSMLKLNDAVTMFRPDAIQNSGYTLILNDGTVHAKLPVPENYEGTGGIVQRRTWENY